MQDGIKYNPINPINHGASNIYPITFSLAFFDNAFMNYHFLSENRDFSPV